MWNCIFGSFKLFPSSKIDFWPFLKLQKMEFCQKNYSWNWFIWFHEFFGLDFFKFSGTLCTVNLLWPQSALLELYWNSLFKKTFSGAKSRPWSVLTLGLSSMPHFVNSSFTALVWVIRVANLLIDSTLFWGAIRVHSERAYKFIKNAIYIKKIKKLYFDFVPQNRTRPQKKPREIK